MSTRTTPVTLRVWMVIQTKLSQWSTRPARLRGMALCRIGLGIAGIDFYISNFGQQNLLFGPRGFVSASMFRLEQRNATLPSLYGLSSSSAYFHAVYLTGFLVAVAFTVFGGRPLNLLHAVFLWSLYNRDQTILDGGDNLASILVILLLLTVTDAYYSPLAERRRRRWSSDEANSRPRVQVLLHNAGVLVITVQVATVYFCAGMWKVAGGLWQDGTAMYYVSRAYDFQFVSLGWLATNAITVTAISYFAIIANIGFPLGLLTKRWRFVTVGNALMMHIGIIVVMGLTGFGLTMIGADLACLSDDEYQILRSTGRRVGRVIGQAVRSRGRRHAGMGTASLPTDTDTGAVGNDSDQVSTPVGAGR